MKGDHLIVLVVFIAIVKKIPYIPCMSMLLNGTNVQDQGPTESQDCRLDTSVCGRNRTPGSG